MPSKKINILECTLRDGSYAIDYQFTPEDTALVASSLERCGVEFIEIGHGVGFNGSPRYGVAAATDEQYLMAAAAVLRKAKFGMFCIPGIGRIEDLELGAKYGMGFVRIGTNVTEVEQAEPFIKRAKELGMLVSSNLMKSYALPIDAFLEKAGLAAHFGADVVSVVDSAGGMMPDEVMTYVSRIRNEIGVAVGFHGHNNLLLAVANTISAVRAGATFVDGTLQGMGRSVGNAQTEILVVLLEKMGYVTGVNLFNIMDLGDKIIRPMMGSGEKGIDSLSATLGYAQFHSSFLMIVYRVAQKYHLDPRELVVKISEVNRVSVTDELAEKVAQELEHMKQEASSTSVAWNVNFDFKELVNAHAGEGIAGLAKSIALEILSLAKKTGKLGVFTIAGTLDQKKQSASFPFIRQNAVYVIGNAEVASVAQAVEIAKSIDGLVDYIMVDVDHSHGPLMGMVRSVKTVVTKSKILTYKDYDALVSAVDSLISQLCPEAEGINIAIVGNLRAATKLQSKLEDRGFRVRCVTTSSELREPTDLLVGLTHFEATVDVTILDHLAVGGMVIDAGPGSLHSDTIEKCHEKGTPVYRVDMRAGLSGEIINALETEELVQRIMGRGVIEGVDVIAGGVLGKKGDIVVDSISHPTKVIGVADGQGHLIAENELSSYIATLQRVSGGIAKMRFV